MRKSAQPIELTSSERRLLESWVRAGTTPQRVARRARIVLQAAQGLASGAISRRLSVSPHTVQLWRARFREGGAASLQRDAPGRGRRPTNAAETFQRVLQLIGTPRDDGRRWSVRLLAEAAGMSRASLHRMLRRFAVTLRHRLES
jgi:transposase